MAQKRKGELVQPPERVRLTVTISAELRRRLGSYAGAYSRDEWQVVEEALTARLKGFYYGQREPGATVVQTVPAAPEGQDRPSLLPIRTG